ncbi:MAG: outer membrane protein assembly factor, partial [Muribaculaceae bacterium]|nr:outer membrane protein assembly factor [Muribaculaceae bacterium]
KNRGNVFNSYEVSLSASLAFPRLLAPNFIRRMQRELNWTTITLSADLLNRPHYFKMAQFNAGINYEWRYSRHVLNSFTPFKLTYTKLLHTTEEFDSVMAINPAVALSFRSQYIPQMSYTYTYDRFFERARINGINFTFTVTEAGNIFDGIYKLCGVKGEKRLFGTPFSQFVKGQAQVVYSRRLIRGTDQWLVSRVLIGAEHAYGNSKEVPYSEQFYIGGANSIRAFTVRSLGPGSYHPPHDLANGYFDQTGTFKLELNTEYRFPIVSILHGALFLDAGNIWLLRNDPLRPGGQLQGSTFLREIALGTGVGLRVDLGMMVLRGDLGYGLHTPYRDGTYHYFNVPFKKAFAFHLAIGYPF